MYHAVSTIMAMRRNGAARDAIRGGDSDAHNFQEYTYKKITPYCMPQVGKCQTKSRLLRRQKSTSEIESHRVQETAFDEESSSRALCMRHGFTKINKHMIHNYTTLLTLTARKKHQRLLPTNLYVILYNFKSRHADELDLKAGYKVTVIDTSDPDWWKGKCLGKIGYFPSKYCTKLQAGERPLQVTHNLQVSDGDNGLMLLRDQIVIQVGDEVDGMVMIRSGDNRQGVCPIKFLQEKRGSFTEETHTLYVPKPIQSAPVTPCDSEASTWSDRASSSRQYYELPSTSDNARYDERPSTSDNTRYNAPSTSDKTRYEESMEGVWWWRRPLGIVGLVFCSVRAER
ncbi:hypothetical protein MSG28_007590 [Choristoneura fumiferana]|uniref:Uncharacterized protein n=1 Tax=Choristoneura fumiferana TaxID=7141 RepID=A0ACC0JXV7_CHOFU|nr:hypothetical protein MSG28_007590 [Choristoneura fumiferana]